MDLWTYGRVDCFGKQGNLETGKLGYVILSLTLTLTLTLILILIFISRLRFARRLSDQE